ncbi:hypothetical protein LCGC14_0582250 [marine sediment metagenome]|uniref:Uncharacterized protein n=1 Tax=marine sediment metagenome TaxID=412755 RepID=A0A0F9RG37_9ZZZZ
MASSGTYAFNPELQDHIDEAFERCGIDPSDLKARHIRSAIRSANLLFSDWQNFGHKQHNLTFVSQTVTAEDQSFTLPAGGYDIFHATLKRDSRETEMHPISRSDYNAITDKTVEGRPDRYFVDRGSFTPSSGATVFTWQAAENSTDTLEIWYMRTQADAGDPANTLAMTPNYQEAFACGMAFHLCRKYAPQRRKALLADYLGERYDEYKNSRPAGAMGRALTEDRDTGDAILRVRFDRYRGRR